MPDTFELARALDAAGVPIIGTTPDSIDPAGRPRTPGQMLHDLGLLQPPNRIAFDVESAAGLADEVGFLLVVRPPMCWVGERWRLFTIRKSWPAICAKRVKVTKIARVIDHFIQQLRLMSILFVMGGSVHWRLDGAYRASGCALR